MLDEKNELQFKIKKLDIKQNIFGEFLKEFDESQNKFVKRVETEGGIN
jgi:hypothetical protein